MMHRQSYPRFLQSEMFHAILQTTYAYNPNSPKPPIPPNSKRNSSSSSSSSSSTNTDQTAAANKTGKRTTDGGGQRKPPSPSPSSKIRPLENAQTQQTKHESQPYLKPTDNSDASTIKTQQYSKTTTSPNENSNAPSTTTSRPKNPQAIARPRSAATIFSENQGKQLDRHNSMPSSQKTPSELQKMKMENKLAARNSTKI